MRRGTLAVLAGAAWLGAGCAGASSRGAAPAATPAHAASPAGARMPRVALPLAVYYVAGEVTTRGAFTLRRDTTLSKALTEAGGVTKRAATGEVRVIRTLATGQKQELGAFDLRAVMHGDRSQDIPLQPQDVVVVPESGAKKVGYAFLDVLKSVLRFSLIAL